MPHSTQWWYRLTMLAHPSLPRSLGVDRHRRYVVGLVVGVVLAVTGTRSATAPRSSLQRALPCSLNHSSRRRITFARSSFGSSPASHAQAACRSSVTRDISSACNRPPKAQDAVGRQACACLGTLLLAASIVLAAAVFAGLCTAAGSSAARRQPRASSGTWCHQRS